MAVPIKVRNQIRYAVRYGKITKPKACEKCEAVFPEQRLALAHVPNLETPLEVIWLCSKCFNRANPRAADAVKRQPRKQVLRIAPPWEQMKADYLDGYTFAELAQRWGLKSGKTGAFKVFKDRAVAHGEWPMQRRTTVQSNVLFDLVKDHIRRTTKSDTVWATQAQATRWAPKCVIEGRREYWGIRPAQYHQKWCPALLRLGNRVTWRPLGPLLAGYGPITDGWPSTGGVVVDVETDPRIFPIPVEEAEDWGYEQCLRCADGMPLSTWGAQHGFNETFVHWLNSGRLPNLSFAKARALLEAINEPIPDTLFTKAELATRKRARRSQRVDRTRPTD